MHAGSPHWPPRISMPMCAQYYMRSRLMAEASILGLRCWIIAIANYIQRSRKSQITLALRKAMSQFHCSLKVCLKTESMKYTHFLCILKVQMCTYSAFWKPECLCTLPFWNWWKFDSQHRNMSELWTVWRSLSLSLSLLSRAKQSKFIPLSKANVNCHWSVGSWFLLVGIMCLLMSCVQR